MIFMQSFDLVALDCASLQEMAHRLGYKRIFCVGKDVEVTEKANAADDGRKKIVRSDSFEALAKSLRRNDFVGMLPSTGSVSKKVLEILKNEEKLLFVPLSGVVSADEASRTQALVKARNLVRSALMAKVNVCIVSMAEDVTGVMSNLQMAEVANFLGMDQGRAKDAISVLGGVL